MPKPRWHARNTPMMLLISKRAVRGPLPLRETSVSQLRSCRYTGTVQPPSRAWRWNSDTDSSCSSALTCRDTADCDRPSCSPACVKLPASAAAWNTFNLSQSIPFFPFAMERFLFCSMLLLYAVVGEELLGLQ